MEDAAQFDHGEPRHGEGHLRLECRDVIHADHDDHATIHDGRERRQPILVRML